MHDCDFMLCIGARFDDRITGRTDAFSPGLVQGPHRHRPLVDQQEHPRPGADRRRRRRGARRDAGALEGARLEDRAPRRSRSGGSRSSSGAAATASPTATPRQTIKPQYALQRLEALTRGRDRYICTEVGQHQMWAAQYLGFEEPNRWMTSRRPRHHGLRLPGLDRGAGRPPGRARHQRRRRGELADEHAGDGHRGAVPAAGQAVHPQQRAARHGAPVAGAPARRALLLVLVRGAARLRQARRGLRRQGHHLSPTRRSSTTRSSR